MQKRTGSTTPSKDLTSTRLPVTKGRSAHREVILGFAPARILYSSSFADVLDEETGEGYQRPFSDQHSLDFRRYIGRSGATTIPLTFNLRPEVSHLWSLQVVRGQLTLSLPRSGERALAQVDCQHRLGHLADSDLELPFMAFIGLTPSEELEIFSVINGKAKGLSSSLLDYHAAHMARDLGKERPELFVALHLNESSDSPWYKQLDMGGSATSGMKRRASLRTMQKAVRRFLLSTNILIDKTPQDVAVSVADYWTAISTVWREQWAYPRRHLLTKGIGVYALMGLLADLTKEAVASDVPLTKRHIAAQLSDFSDAFDWTASGPLKGLGGESGAEKALELLRAARAAAGRHLRLINNG